MVDAFLDWMKDTGFGAANRMVTGALVLAVGLCLIKILLILIRRGLSATKL